MTATTATQSPDSPTKHDSGHALRPKRNRSRAGCFTCRLRRKKCDEVHPKCGTCTKHVLKCIWPRKGQGRLTKEMREKMKREVDLYDESSLLVPTTSPPVSEGPASRRGSRTQAQHFVNYAIDHASKALVLHSTDLPMNDASQIFNSQSSGEDEEDLEASETESHTEGSETAQPVAEPTETPLEQSHALVSTRRDREEWASFLDSPGNLPGTPQTGFFWEKLFDMNFTEPIVSPNFSIISPVCASPLPDGDLVAAASIMSTVHTEDDLNAYGLDEEQTEKFYGKLMEKFVDWTSTNNQTKRTSVAKLMSQYQFTQQDLLLYYTCVYYFLPAVGPQQTLPQLTTTETFVPLLTQHPIVKDVFLCCGATFLAWCQPQKYSQLAERLYQSSKSRLQKELASDRIRGDETWAFACFQLLCLTNKLHNGEGISMVDRCVDNLAHSFNIIKRKYQTIKERGSTPTDRMLIESFMYNYTVSLLVARDLSKLPNPFSDMFANLTTLLKSPIFNDCDVEWMNNPVLGPSIDAFGMLAKVSFLSRMPLPLTSPHWTDEAQKLLQDCLYYTPPQLPEEVRNDERKYEVYRPGLLSGSIISKACYLLLSKIIRYDDFDVRNLEIQGVVKYSIQSLRDIEKGNPLLCILLWSLLIIGAFSVDPEDRLVIKEYLKSTSETIHSYGALKIDNLLELIWDRDDINLLFVRENISQVII